MKMILKLLFFVLYISKSLAGYSKVFQGVEHGIYMSEYCPKMKHCPEGTHVVCMHNPDVNQGRGPSCHSSKSLAVNEQLSDEILSITNSIRRNIVKGVETGKGGENLPKGYGIWRLRWDDDLALFAQVLANQCTLKHDLCRATHEFSDPGQTVGIMRFTYPTWEPIKSVQQSIMDKPLKGFSTELVEYAVLNIVKKWYKQKKNVTPQHIEELNWDRISGSYEGTLYLQLVYGFSTHMGCGVSAFTDYIFNVNNADLIYNVILLVCNFSARPTHNGPVYMLSQSQDVPSSPQGCPTKNSTEDQDGLCNPLPPAVKTAAVAAEIVPLKGPKLPTDNCGDCRQDNPPVLLLPIFTVEDGYPQYRNMSTLKSRNNTHENDYDENFRSRSSQDNTRKHNNMKNIVIDNRRKPSNKRERYIGNIREYVQIPNDNYYNISKKRQVLKQRPYMPLRTRKNNIGETDQDRQLIDTNDKCAGDQCNEMDVYTEKSFIRDSPVEYDDNMETYTVRYPINIKHHKTEESDRKLMRLLDHLEEEVKHVNLDNDEKEVINLKIRKIYSILGNNLYKLRREETITNSLTQNRDYPIHISNDKPEPQRKFGNRRSMSNRYTESVNRKSNKDVIGPKKSLKRSNYNRGATNNNINNQEYAYFGRNFYEKQMDNGMNNGITGTDFVRRTNINNRPNYLFSRPVKSEKRTKARRSKPKDVVYLPERTIHT